MKFKIQLFIVCFIFIFDASSSFSQSRGMRRWIEESPCWRASELNLSQVQRKSLDLIQFNYFRDTQLLRIQLFTKRLELRELITNPMVGTESIRGKTLEIIELQSKQEEKDFDYLIKVRNLLTPEQLKDWCPEQEFPAFWQKMHGMGHMGPMHPKKTFPPKE